MFIIQWSDRIYCSPNNGGLTDDEELRFECVQGDNGTYIPVSDCAINDPACIRYNRTRFVMSRLMSHWVDLIGACLLSEKLW